MVWEIPSYARIPTQDGKIDGPKRLTTTGPVEIRSVSFNHGIVDDSVFGWIGIDLCVIPPGTTKGEHVGRYVKTYRAPGATAPAWAVCFEVTDWSGIGPLCGVEVDVISAGRDPSVTRRAVWAVLGKTRESVGPAHYDRAFDVTYRDFDPAQATLDVAYHCSVPCRVFAAVPPGSWVTWDLNGNVGEVFDAPTGYQLQGRSDIIGEPEDWTRAALAFQRDTGEVCQFGKTIIPPVPPQFRPLPGDTREDWAKRLAAWRRA